MPKMVEYAAKYASKIHRKSQKTHLLIWSEKNLFIVCQNYIYYAATDAEKFQNFVVVHRSLDSITNAQTHLTFSGLVSSPSVSPKLLRQSAYLLRYEQV